MLRRRRSSWLALPFLVLLAAAPGAQALQLSLQELVSGPTQEFDSADGTLHFSEFTVTISGALSASLSDYVVVVDSGVVANGFQLVGPIGVSGGNSGDVVLRYLVTANGGQVINGAGLFFNGRAVGTGALANIEETLRTEAGALLSEDLSVFVAGDDPTRQLEDSTGIASPLAALRVTKDVTVTSGTGVFASISVIDQSFTVVPEPETAAMFGMGLIGLIWLGRQRRAGTSG